MKSTVAPKSKALGKRLARPTCMFEEINVAAKTIQTMRPYKAVLQVLRGHPTSPSWRFQGIWRLIGDITIMDSFSLCINKIFLKAINK